MDKLRTIHELADFYTFTNIREAKKLLAEQSILLQKHQNTEGVLRFHLNTAIVENQFYNFKQSDKHFRLALKIVEDEGNATQQAEVYIDYAGTLMNLGEKEQALDCIEKAHRHLASFPDAVLRIHSTIVNRDPESAVRLAVRWSLDGTHTGYGHFGEPTGATVHIMAMSHVHITQGRVVSDWLLTDEVAIWKQLFALQAKV